MQAEFIHTNYEYDFDGEYSDYSESSEITVQGEPATSSTGASVEKKSEPIEQTQFSPAKNKPANDPKAHTEPQVQNQTSVQQSSGTEGKKNVEFIRDIDRIIFFFFFLHCKIKLWLYRK